VGQKLERIHCFHWHIEIDEYAVWLKFNICRNLMLSNAQWTSPRFLIFRFFSNPPDPLGPPVYWFFKEVDFCKNSSFHFLSLLVLFTPNFHGKITCFCIYFSFMLYDNLLLFFPSLCSHVMSLLKFRPSRLVWPPFIKIRNFFWPHVY